MKRSHLLKGIYFCTGRHADMTGALFSSCAVKIISGIHASSKILYVSSDLIELG